MPSNYPSGVTDKTIHDHFGNDDYLDLEYERTNRLFELRTCDTADEKEKLKIGDIPGFVWMRDPDYGSNWYLERIK